MPETPPPSSQKRTIFTPQAEDPAQNQPAVPARRTTLPVSLSLILLGSAIIIGGVIVGWTSFFQQTDNIQISLESVSAQPAGNLEMTGAHYSGTTENGLKFSINAERAVESAPQKGLVRLFAPDGFVSSDKDGKTNLSSNEAIYHTAERRLDMTGNVSIFQSRQNLTLSSEEMTALFGKGELLTEKPVTLQGPDIFLTSQGMHATENGDVILFTGKSRIELKQN